MANPVCEVLLTDVLLQSVDYSHDGSGAVVEFYGIVRPLEVDREISGIEYEAHRAMAFYQLERIAREAITRFGLQSAILHHRVGFVPVGEASVYVRTTSRNRAETYRANAWIMEELKTKVPIWKQPKFKPAGQTGPIKPEPVSRR